MAKKESHIGLSLGAQSVSGAEFSASSDGGLTLHRYQASQMVADPAVDDQHLTYLDGAVKEVAGALQLKGRALRYSISSQPVFVRFVTLPPLDIDQVDQIVEFEAQQNVPFPINEVVWNYQLMGVPDDPEVEVMLAAIKSDELAEIDDVVAASGVKTKSVEVAPMALFNAFRYNYSDLSETTLMIDIGARTTNLIYVEDGKAFIRTIKIGGADITKAIAKEFGVSFEEAEQRKIADGFVALGGPYADHDDPVVAGISKVIRNTLTRLHSEIMRTTNFYRSQQGGSAPQLGLLCGGTAGLPYIRDFFAEKLNITIDYFNALRNVSIAPGGNAEAATSNAHCLGELVGGALRDVTACPIELDLVPESVKEASVVAAKKPFLWVATFVLALALGAVGLYYKKATDLTSSKAEERAKIEGDLKRHDKSIEALKSTLADLEQRKDPYVRAAFDRAYWLEIFRDLNERMGSDKMWITVMEPLSEGESVTDAPSSAQGTGAIAPTIAAVDGEAKTIDTIRIKGLYRNDAQDSANSSKVVHAYYDKLAESPYFAFEGKDKQEILKELELPDSADVAWSWVMELPLPDNELSRIAFQK